MAFERDRFLPPLWILTLCGVVGAAWLLVRLRDIVVLLILAYSIAYLLNPFLSFLERRKVNRAVGVIIAFALVLVGLLVVVLTAAPTIGMEFDRLVTEFPTYTTKARATLSSALEAVQPYLPERFAHNSDAVVTQLSNAATSSFNQVLSGTGGALAKGVSLTMTLLNIALLPIMVFYIAVGFSGIHQALLKIFPPSVRSSVLRCSREIDVYISAFMRGQLIVGCILCVLYAVGLGVIGVELWLLLAIIAGFGNLVPYLGFAVGVVLSSILALATFGDFSHLAYVWGLFLVVQVLEGTLITPTIVGDKVGLSPLIILISIFAGGQLFGLLGIFLAIPGAAILRVLGRNLHAWIHHQAEGAAA